jgi:ABC-2 type transport system ATP-binding protein
MSAECALHPLRSLAGVTQVEIYREQVTLKTTDADATVRDLVTSDIAWKDLEVQSASLEDVFMALVGNGAHSGNGGNR